MYIISKFHDYYDSIIGITGIDKKNPFNRVQKIIDYKENKTNVSFSVDYSSPNSYLNTHKMKYPISFLTYDLYIVNSLYKGYCFFSNSLPDHLKEKYSSRKVKINTHFQRSKFQIDTNINNYGYLLFNHVDIIDFLTVLEYDEKQIKRYLKEPISIDNEVFKSIGSPVFMTAKYLLENDFLKFTDSKEKEYYMELEKDNTSNYRSGIIVTNPILSQIGIPNMMESLKIFQDISMYIADVNNIEVETHMTDIEKRNAKGFNDKSFKHRK